MHELMRCSVLCYNYDLRYIKTTPAIIRRKDDNYFRGFLDLTCTITVVIPGNRLYYI